MIGLLVALGILGVAAVVALLLARWPRWATAVGTLGPVLACLVAMGPAWEALLGGAAESFRQDWSLPIGQFALRLDPLAAFFLIPTVLIAALAAVYGAGYLHRAQGYAWMLYNLMLASLLLVLLSDNGLLFLLSWEAMSITSFLLVILDDEHASVRRGGLVYLVATHLGTAFLLVLFLMLSPGGSMDLAAPASAVAGTCFWLALIGFGTKAGFVPLHVWLPQAHPAAPSHVSALLSGIILKTGVYGLLRTLTLLGPPQAAWGWTLLVVGVSSGILGVVFALAQHNLKRLLAYHSVENLGIIAIGLGLGLLGQVEGNNPMMALGYAGGLLHVWNHAVFKSLLFLGAGAVGQSTGTLDVEHLGGLAKSMPRTALTFLVGSAAISGLPPFNGFVSELLIFLAAFVAVSSSSSAIVVAGLIGLSGLALISGLAIACFAKAFGVVFLGEPRAHLHKTPVDPPAAMLAPMLVLAGLCLALGVGGTTVVQLVAPTLAQVSETPVAMVVTALERCAPALGGFALLGAAWLVLTAFLLDGLRRVRPSESLSTWGCGYLRPTARMQYTAASFAQPLTDIFSFALQSRHDNDPVRGLFPRESSLHSHTPDPFERLFFRPILKNLRAAAARARVFQHGRVQLYVLYVLATVVALIVAVTL